MSHEDLLLGPWHPCPLFLGLTDHLPQALVPVTIEVDVPFDLHRYIIGQKGSGIRRMMDEFEVNIHVPAPELQSDIIAITGLAANLDRAKAGLLERVRELQAEQEDRVSARQGFQAVRWLEVDWVPQPGSQRGDPAEGRPFGSG